MSEDRELRDFARLVREAESAERAGVPSPWDELCDGRLSEAEEERLQRAAGASEEARADYETFRPLGADFQARLVDSLHAGIVDETGGPEPEVLEDERPESRVLPFPRAWQAWVPAAAAAVLVLAVATFWLGRRLGEGPAGARLDGAQALPPYSLEVDGGARRRSTAADGPEVLVPDATFRITLRPEVGISRDVTARFYVARAEEWREWPVTVTPAGNGTLRVEERLDGDLLLEPGRWRVVAAVGPPDALPASDEVAARFAAGDWTGDGDWQLLAIPVEVEAGALEVEYRGCEAVLGPAETPTCILPASGELALWTSGPGGPDSRLGIVSEKRSWHAPDGVPVDGGVRFELEDLAAGELVVRVSENGDPVFRLSLASSRLGVIFEAYRRADQGGSAAVRAYLEERLDREDPPLVTGAILSHMSRTAGDPRLARREVEEAILLHRRAGNLSREINDLTYLHQLLRFQIQDYEAAREVLYGQIPEPARGDAYSAYLVAFYRGQWALGVGDPRNALDQLEVATRKARRAGTRRQDLMARQLQAHQLRRLGQHRRATEIFEELVAERERFGTCRQAKILNGFAWDRLLALEARRPVENPMPELDEALALVEECPAGEEEERANLRVNRALASLHAGDVPGAQRELAQARGLGREPSARLLEWQHDVEARLALAEGQTAEALRSYDALGRLAEEGDRPDVAWRAAVGRAGVFERLGRLDDALVELERAETLLDEESLRAPIDAGRETSMAAREWATRHYLGLLVGDGQAARALGVARRARSRFFRGLAGDARHWTSALGGDFGRNEAVLRYQERRSRLEVLLAEYSVAPSKQQEALEAELDATRRELGRLLDGALADSYRGVPSGDLPAVGPGELLLLYHPAPEGWFAFATDGRRVAAHRLAEIDLRRASPAEHSRVLLEPFAGLISTADRLRVLAYGASRAIDFHALPFAGDALAASRPVVYGLDLPAPAVASGGRALVVEDPTGSLVGASEEVDSVANALRRNPDWRVQVLRGRQARDLRELLPSADLLHFAGHGDVLGQDLEAGLKLDRDGSQLTVGDLLTRERVPAAVVLSACDGARASDEAPVGLGVAHAFLLAGSRVVIGAARPVDDRHALALVRHLYRFWDGSAEGAAAALADAQTALRRADPSADWSSFRVLER